jgi:hypothetical protein
MAEIKLKDGPLFVSLKETGDKVAVVIAPFLRNHIGRHRFEIEWK